MIITEVEFNDCGSSIAVFTRNKDGKRIKTVKPFKHYFYAKDEENGQYTTLFGDKVRKIPIHQMWLQKQITQGYDKTYEADLNYTKRFLADHGHEFKSESDPRVVFWDIETTSLDPETGIIISIVAYDTYTKEYYEFIHGEGLELKKERDMILKFARWIKKIEPDVMSGWNCSNFDWMYLIDRMEKTQIPLSVISPMGKVDRFYTNQGEQIRVRGIAMIDMLQAYRKMSYYELETYRLDFVAEQELGVGKNEISVLPGKLWERGSYDKLLLYNFRDVQILRELDEKLGIIKFFDKISEIASCPLEECLYNSRVLDSYILRYTSSKGIILPTKDFTRKSSGYKGGAVLDPVKGVHKQVCVLDINHLYPAILISFNLSPETIRTRDSNLPSASETMGKGPQYKGLIPLLLDDLITLRKQYKDEGKDNEQRVVKEITNAMYGTLAFSSFRLYTPELAEEVTRRGREIIHYVKEVVENE